MTSDQYENSGENNGAASTDGSSGVAAGKADRARAALIAAIDAQLEADDPPETRQTLQRLVEAGHSREAALKLIASALIAEVTNVLREDSQYDRDRYVANLNKLPTLPWQKPPQDDAK